MKKIISLLLAVLFIFGLYYIIDNTELNEKVLFSSNEATVTVERYENRKFESVKNFDEIAFKYNDVVAELKKGFAKHSEEIDIYSYKVSVEELNAIVEYLCVNNGYYYVENGYTYYEDGKYVRKICPSYIMSSEEVLKNNAEIDKVINDVAQKAAAFKTDIEKLIYVHDYIVDNITYDEGNLKNNNIYGALVLKDSMCMGYAEAFSAIANKLGYNYLMLFQVKHWSMLGIWCFWTDVIILLTAHGMIPYFPKCIFQQILFRVLDAMIILCAPKKCCIAAIIRRMTGK